MNAIAQFFRDVKRVWKLLWKSKVFKLHFGLTLVFFAVVGHYCALNISIWETRKGTLLLDPFLQYLHPRDYSIAIFCIIHSALFLSIFLLLPTPKELLKGFQAYSILLLLRTIFIYGYPLEPPAGMIYLNDPLIGLIMNNVHVVTKDLFFSGHISTMCLFIYFSQNSIWKKYLMFATPVLAALILCQHVHYTIDIIAAPFFAFLSCRFIDVLNDRWEYGINNATQQTELIKN